MGGREIIYKVAPVENVVDQVGKGVSLKSADSKISDYTLLNYPGSHCTEATWNNVHPPSGSRTSRFH